MLRLSLRVYKTTTDLNSCFQVNTKHFHAINVGAMLAKASVLILCFTNLLKSVYAPVFAPPFCKEADEAIEQLEHYYTHWYRIRHALRTSTLCRMKEDQMKRCCAKIIKYCMGQDYEKIDIKVIETQIKDIKQCQKEKLEKLNEDDLFTKKKRMFLCPAQKICTDEACLMTKPILISAGGLINSAIIFYKMKKDDLRVKPLYFIENLNFEFTNSTLKTIAQQDVDEVKEKPNENPSPENKPPTEEKTTPKGVEDK